MKKTHGEPFLFIDFLIELLADAIMFFINSFSKILIWFLKKIGKKIESSDFKFLYFIRAYIDKNKQEIESKDLKITKVTTDFSTLGFSLTKKRAIHFKEIDTRRHILIIGASGFGKSNLIKILTENDLREKRGVMQFDPKGSLEAILEFENLCEKYDRKFYIFSEHYNQFNTFNPLKGMGRTEQVSLIMRSFSWDNEYYAAEAELALDDAIEYLANKDLIISFQNVFNVLNERYESKNREKIAGLLAKLKRIVSSSFGKLLVDNGDALSIQDIRRSKACFYVGLSTQGFGDLARTIGKIFLNALLYHSYEVSRDATDSNISIENPLSVYFDELGSIIVSDFIDLLNKCRSSGIRLTSAIQSLSDLDNVSVPLRRQVWENCNNIFIQKQSSYEDREYIARGIATMPDMKSTVMTIDNEETEKGTIRESYKYLCHPSLLTELNVGQTILLRHSPKNLDLINLRLANLNEEKK